MEKSNNDHCDIDMLRHSCSHIMAEAVQKLYPDAKLAIGPAIENGFYYDFDLSTRLTEEDLGAIENVMHDSVKNNSEFIRQEMASEDAIRFFEQRGENYKVELIKDLQTDTVSVYRHGDFVDLCRGPHAASTGRVRFFKLLSVAGAYWKGNEKNKMLQRIYGTAFKEKHELKEYLRLLEEAKQRDHRKIGKEQGLYEMSDNVGQGLVLWTPRGGRIRSAIEDFWRKEHYKNGYEIIYTPHIGRSLLWQTSGHLDFYKEGMYSSMDIEEEDYYVKPMNCPFHVEIFKSQKRSYRDFPIRWCELGTVYRYERSGTMHGLLRVRGFTQDDAHIFCRLDQLEEEITAAFNFSLYMLKRFGFETFAVKLSTRPEKEYVGSIEIWDKAEAALGSVLNATGMDYVTNKGDGAFYGPKIDIAVKDAIGREWQLSTVQLDFNLPERFDLSYTGSDGNEHRPIMIHRALLGSLERFFGILIEHYKGSFPLWLSPVQVKVLSLKSSCEDYAVNVTEELKSRGFRVEVDLRQESLNKKIRQAELERVPYILVIGEAEQEEKTVNVRTRGKKTLGAMSLDEFLDKLTSEIKN